MKPLRGKSAFEFNRLNTLSRSFHKARRGRVIKNKAVHNHMVSFYFTKFNIFSFCIKLLYLVTSFVG